MTDFFRLDLTPDDSGLITRLQVLSAAIEDPRPVLLEFQAYMRQQTVEMFERNAHGGAHRGKTWPPFKPQYTRKTDGMVVPAWGGVPKLRGGGMVLGRLRPSGKRITPTSNLMRDYGAMYQRAGMALRWEDNGKTIVMATPQSYAPKQQKMRPFSFYQIPQDPDKLVAIAREHLTRAGQGESG